VLIPLGIGMGIFQSPNNSAIMGSMPREYAGLGAGVLSITRLLGQVTGVAVLGSLWASRVASIAGQEYAGNASAAPGSAQVAALRDVFLWGVGLASRNRHRGVGTTQRTTARRTMSRQWTAAVVFGASAAVLVVELAAIRLLAPYVGQSLETFTAIVTVVLAGISVGTWVGGESPTGHVTWCD
jgi:hypothetical protein